MTDCPGPCNRHWRAARDAHADAIDTWAAADPETRGQAPDPPDLTPVPGEPVWCRRCAGAVRAALADLDNLAAILTAASDGHRGHADDTGRIRSTKTSPSPSPAADLLDELYGDLCKVETDWREVCGYGPRPARGRGASALTTVIAWLGHHLTDILAHPGSVDFGLRVLRWQRRLQAAAKARPPGRRKPAPCPRCDRRTLIFEDDRELVRCENLDCNRVMTVDEYDAHAAQQAGRTVS
ncbi:MAG TPA: hypothetical protein VKZ89_20150 [Thermobifida alba]|nr:hypothetical protein [Thermobifida alba]